MKTLNTMRKYDFSKFNPTHTYEYLDMVISITWDYLNNRWTYSSNTHSVSGVYYGNINDLKAFIKEEYNKL